ncbi:MAG: PAS domain-containing protein [Rhodospirillales bacterium]|nr:PAS domain-containing protein [Rhodospirillales bacterium]
MNPDTPGPAAWIAEPAGAAFDTAGWNARLARLYAHWRKIHPAPGVLPGRQHFSPFDLPEALPSVWMLDVQREPFRLKYRLIGTNMVRMIGGDYTGLWFDEARPQLLKAWPGLERYRLMVDTGRATWRKGKPTLTVDPYWHLSENVMMPLAQDGRSVDMLLCASVFYGHDGKVL